LLSLCIFGCEGGFPPASQLSSLRVLAVQPQPASATPGESVRLSMLLHDGRDWKADADEPPIAPQVVWLTGCHNPPTRQFYACYPLIHAVSRKWAEAGDPVPAVVPGFLGSGTQFELVIPDDILSGVPRSATDAVHFGVSYVFFAACTGELRFVDGSHNRLPIGCFDPVTNERLGSDDYVEGFTTLFSYEGNVNQNPTLEEVRFSGANVTAGECQVDTDCAEVDSGSDHVDEYACGESGMCVPVIDRCSDDDDACKEYEISTEVSPSSAEPDPTAAEGGGLPGEILWTKYYADAGDFGTDTRLVHDRQLGWMDRWTTSYLPVSTQTGSVHIFATLHDNRGGADWLSFEVLLRDPD
jgi:hypothetical protein